MHKLKLIHRDIKPDNIMITGQNKCKTADFGTARLVDDNNKFIPDKNEGLNQTFGGSGFYMS